MDDEYRQNLKERIREHVDALALQAVGLKYKLETTITIKDENDVIEAAILTTNGRIHNWYGPAVEYSDHVVEWWVNDKEITEDIQDWLLTLPHYSKWTQKELVLFKLKWS